MKSAYLDSGTGIARLVCGAALVFASSGCSEDSDPNGPQAESDSAVLVGGLLRTVEGYNLYAAALPEVPSGDVEYSKFREFSATDAYLYTHAGYVFLWEGESLEMQRFSVSPTLELLDGPTLSLSTRVPGASNHVFISPRRAYSLSTDLDAIVVWDPEAMEITGTIPIEPLDRPAGMSSFAYWGRGDVVGDHVIWEIVSTDEENNTAYPATTLLIASATSDEPVRFIEDSRCVGGGGAHVDAKGDYYVRAGALWGRFAAFDPSVRTCVLRVKSGEVEFDPDYLVDLEELTGSYVNYPWFHVTGSKYVAHAWDPELPLPETLDDFYASDASTRYRQLLVDVQAGTAEPYPDLEGGHLISSDEFRIDGVSYYQYSETGYVEDGSSDIVELHPSGVVQRFHVPGSLWAFARIR